MKQWLAKIIILVGLCTLALTVMLHDISEGGRSIISPDNPQLEVVSTPLPSSSPDLGVKPSPVTSQELLPSPTGVPLQFSITGVNNEDDEGHGIGEDD